MRSGWLMDLAYILQPEDRIFINRKQYSNKSLEAFEEFEGFLSHGGVFWVHFEEAV